MRKLIDLDDATFKTLSKKAIDKGKKLKIYIQDILVKHSKEK